MKSVLLMILLTICNNLYAKSYDFKYFNLKEQKSNGFMPRSFEKRSNILNLEERLTTLFTNIYEKVGKKEIAKILDYKKAFELGENNFAGFKKTFKSGVLKVRIEREILPDLNKEDRWIVEDKLIIEVNGEEYLQDMDQKGMIDITNENLSLFADAYFKREYTFEHHANSYKEGLNTNLRSLFMMFELLINTNYKNIGIGESIKKDDFIGLKVKANVTLPPIYYITIKGGVKLAYANMSNIIIRRSEEKSDDLKISYTKEKTRNYGVNLSVGLDLYKIISLNLFSTNREEFRSKAFTTTLNLDRYTLANMGPKLEKCIQSLIQFRKVKDKEIIEPYIASVEEYTKEKLKSQYLTLMWGSSSASFKEYIKIDKQDEIKYYYKMAEEQETFAKGFSLFSKNANEITFDARRFKSIHVEYETDKNYRALPRYINDLGTNRLLYKITSELEVKKIPFLSFSKYMSYLKDFLKDYFNIGELLKEKIDDYTLKAPFTLKINSFIGENAIAWLIDNKDRADELLQKFCRNQETRSKKYKCSEKVGEPLKNFLSKLNYTDGKISINTFRYFLKMAKKYAKHPSDLEKLFGTNNIFSNGIFEAKTKDKYDFKTYLIQGPKEKFTILSEEDM